MENVVAIVGRSNVGKSTLFNRLVGTRNAITDDTINLTRDRNYDVAEWGTYRFTLVDTGGYVLHQNDIFTKTTQEQIQIAIHEACVVLFVVDCKEGITDLDKAFAQVLRKKGKPVLVVANKADNPSLALHAAAFYALGLGKVYEVAATHGEGTGDLLDALITHLEAKDHTTQDKDLPKITLLGRPNVGKSTLLNAILGYQRSAVTPLPHTTRDATHSYYRLYGKRLIITDTAGIRKKTQVKQAIEFYAVMRAIKAMQQADVCIILLSAEDGLTLQDKHLIRLAFTHRKGVVLAVNKWDLIVKDTHTAQVYRKNLLNKLGTMNDLPLLFTAGLKKQHIYQTLEKALEVYENRRKRIPTLALNKIIYKAVTQTPPPTTKGKLITIKYATQLPTPTPTFAFFCNLPQYVKPAYKRFLEQKIRQHFNFQGVPLTLIFKKK